MPAGKNASAGGVPLTPTRHSARILARNAVASATQGQSQLAAPQVQASSRAPSSRARAKGRARNVQKNDSESDSTDATMGSPMEVTPASNNEGYAYTQNEYPATSLGGAPMIEDHVPPDDGMANYMSPVLSSIPSAYEELQDAFDWMHASLDDPTLSGFPKMDLYYLGEEGSEL